MRPSFWAATNLLAAAVCGAGAGALTSQRGEVRSVIEAPTPSTAPVARAQSVDLESLAAQIDELRSSLSMVAQVVESRSRPPAPAPVARGPLAPSASMEETRGRLDQALEQEAQSADDRRFETEIQQRFLAALPRGVSLRELSCRASLCKLDVVYPDFASFQRFIAENVDTDTSVWTNPWVIDVPEDAGPTSVNLEVAIYLGRRAELFR